MKRRLPILVIAALGLAVGLFAGGSFAFWSASGGGNGSAAVNASQGVTVLAATGTPSSSLVPGGQADLVLEVYNPNSYVVRVVGIAQRGTSVTPVGATGPGTACTASTTGVTVPTATGLDLSVPSGMNVTLHIPNGVSMGTSSPSGCQGATFQVPVDVEVQR